MTHPLRKRFVVFLFLFFRKKFSFSSFLHFNDRIFNPLTKRRIYRRKLSILNFLLNWRKIAANSQNLTVGRGVIHLRGDTGDWGELEIYLLSPGSPGYGWTENHFYSFGLVGSQIMSCCCCFFTFLHKMNMRGVLSCRGWGGEGGESRKHIVL